MTTYSVLYYLGDRRVEWREVPRRSLKSHEVRVRSLYSGISLGTERLFFTGMVPEGIPVDPTQPALAGAVSFPMPYGYSLVGTVEEVGPDADPRWLNQTVFAFHPHASGFEADPERLTRLPGGLAAHLGVFLPNLETAVHLVLDGRPLIGERVGVYGLGVVGQLLTMLLAEFPLAWLEGYDPIAERRALGLCLGLDAASYPRSEPVSPAETLDLIYEVSGAADALPAAVYHGAAGSRIIVGSWYEQDHVSLRLNHRFHRGQVTIRSSQVSRLPADLSAAWTTDRRLDISLRKLQQNISIIDSLNLTFINYDDFEVEADSVFSQQSCNINQYIIIYC